MKIQIALLTATSYIFHTQKANMRQKIRNKKGKKN
jgi:hypothetical protein